MFSPETHIPIVRSLRWTVLMAVVGLVSVGATSAFAARDAGFNRWQQEVADSLSLLVADASVVEPDIQTILDDLGTGLDAVADLLPDEYFAALPGCGSIELLAEYSSTSDENQISAYTPGDTLNRQILLLGPTSPYDTAMFTLSLADSIALHLYHPPYASWFSETGLNFDGNPHVKFYPGPNPNSYYMFWEDLPWLSDADFNDLVALLRLPVGLPEIVCSPPQEATFCDTTILCVYFTATHPTDDSLAVEILTDLGPESRVVASGVEDSVCLLIAETNEYSVAIAVTDDCGLTTFCASGFIVTVNEPPIITVRDTTLFVCDTEAVCVPFAISDPDHSGGFTIEVTQGPGVIDTIVGKVIVPGNPGTTIVIVKVTDSCGACGYDTLTVDVTVNSPPSIVLGDGAPVFQCEPGEFCIGYTVGDPDGLVGLVEMLASGPPGAVIDTASNTICFLPDTSGTYTLIATVTDSCGASASDTSMVIVTANEPPELAFGSDTAISQCSPAEICVGYTVSDPDGLEGLIESQITGLGVLDTAANTVCFTPDTSGLYTIIAQVADPCGELDTDTILVDVEINGPPSIVMSDGASYFLCGPEEITLLYIVDDPDGLEGLTEDLIFSPAGSTIDTSANSVSFTPSATGQYIHIVRVTDSCGLTDGDSTVIDVTINSAPTISLNNGVPVFQCEPGAICIQYDVADADGLSGLIEELVDGPGTIDTLGNELCFTPDTTGTYTIVVRVSDSCGASDEDTISVFAEANEPPAVAFGSDTTLNQCAPTEICLTYSVADPNGVPGVIETLPSGFGTLDTTANSVCFTPDTSGTYTFIVEAADPCGSSDQDTVQVTVTINDAPIVKLGNDTAIFLCSPEEICFDYLVSDPDGVAGLIEYIPGSGGSGGGGGGLPFALGEPGPYLDTLTNQICLTPSESGVHCLIVGVSDSCGIADADTICVTVTFNTAPTVGFDDDQPINQCAPAVICVPYSVEDADGVTGMVEEILTGPADAGIFTDNDMICFTPDTSGVYTLVVQVTDSCGLTGRDTLNLAVAINSAPTITLEPDRTLFLCDPLPICVGYVVSDPDGIARLVETQVGGPGAIDTAANEICFTPQSSGVFTFIAKVTDSCGQFDQDTSVVTVTLNSDPQFLFGNDTLIRLCESEEICLSYSVFDPDGPNRLTESPIFVPSGAVIDTASNTACFTPDTSGVYEFVAAVNDSCGDVGVDTILVSIEYNLPPSVAFGDDFAAFQCTFEEICLGYVVTDPHGLGQLTEMMLVGDGNATIDTAANHVCFTPAAPGVYQFAVEVSDSCGETDTDTITVMVDANRPPEFESAGNSTLLACAVGEFCVDAAIASDPDGDLDTVVVTSGIGTLDLLTGILCFDGDTSGVYCFEIVATDSCGASDSVTICVDVEINLPPSITLGSIPGELVFLEPTQLCLPISAQDPNLDQQFEVTMIEGLGSYAPTLGRNSLGQSHCFTVDTTGCYQFVFEIADSCGELDYDTTLICVDIERPDTLFEICIDTARGINGQMVTLPIIGKQLMRMGGFDLLVCYDNTALGFVGVEPTGMLAHWEYFTFRTGSSTGCFTCPDGVVRLLGIADMNNGAAHPPEGAFVPKGPMVELSFFITPDRTFIGQCAPVGFCWEVCADNAISDPSGDTTYLSYDNVEDSCFDGDKNSAIPRIVFCNGAVCIVPPEDDRGDLNLNGIANEVGDGVLYTNFFIYGHSVWDPEFKDNQILASDVNCDGNVLTVADLVYMIRIITGDSDPIDCPDVGLKIAANHPAAHVILERSGDRLDVSIDADADMGGVLIGLTSDGGTFGRAEWSETLTGMNAEARVTDGVLRALILPEERGAGIAAGRQFLFSIPIPAAGDLRIEEIQASSHDGQVIPTEVIEAGATRPSSYSLQQNYPNPFNAGTVIRFSIPVAQNWDLTIYNVLGQSVRRFSGHSGPGESSVSWDGTRDDGESVGSGIYFARFQAGEFAATRKMLMIK